MINADYVIVGRAKWVNTAYKLLEARKSVIVVEREERIGGLAKVFHMMEIFLI